MAKKCLACGAPLEGFFAKIAAFAGVKPSAKNPDYCNKCEDKAPGAAAAPSAVPGEPAKVEDLVKKETPTDLFEDAEKKTEE